MPVKAACPGVSMNVTVLGIDDFGSEGGSETENAPIR